MVERRRIEGTGCLHLQWSMCSEEDGNRFLRNVGVSLSRDIKTHLSFVFRTRGITLRRYVNFDQMCDQQVKRLSCFEINTRHGNALDCPSVDTICNNPREPLRRIEQTA
jgi:hypothetical protein